MAQRAVSPDALTCPICLDILKDPATLPCGHSYCMDCIQTNWDQEVRHSCPQCRETFSPRPVLKRNTVLANLVEELKATGLSLQPHRDAAVLQRHQLVAPSDKLQESLCSEHNELKKVFCRTDQQLICSLCCMDQHQGHHTVSSAAERAQRQKQLEAKRALLQQNLQDKETEQDRLRQEAQDISRSAQTAVQRSGDSFREMALLLEKRRSEVEQQIRSEEQIQLKLVQELQDQLQRDVTELRRNISELDTLSLTPDHNQFILRCPSLSTDSEETESRTQTRDFGEVTRAVSELKDKLQLTLREFKMFEPELSSREDFLRYARDITLDPNTAHKRLSLSDGNRRATFMLFEQPGYTDHPDRFVNQFEVLSTESLTGRCYWEVEYSGIFFYRMHIAVCYRDIQRNGTNNECGFGNNDKSWALRCHRNSYSFWFNAVESHVSGPISKRIGVYLDHSAGALSFYSVSNETMSLLHRVQTTFTQPLSVGVEFFSIGDSAHFLQLK